MTSRLFRLLPLFVTLLCSWVLAARPDVARAESLVIAAGTSLVADIVNDLGGGVMTAKAIMPAAACPGHTDLKASDLARLHQARAILLHDWQAHMDAVMGPLQADASLAAKVRVVDAPGNWMVPDRQEAATAAVARILADIDPPHAVLYREKARERAAAIAGLAETLAARAAPARNVPVLADAQQEPLLAWFGFHVAARYGRFEESGPQQLAKALQTARQAKVRLVVDNLQSSGGSGKPLAEDLNAAFVVLSNFPGAFPEAPTWAATVTENLDRCLAALASHGN